jgi:hypothetical protein
MVAPPRSDLTDPEVGRATNKNASCSVPSYRPGCGILILLPQGLSQCLGVL